MRAGGPERNKDEEGTKGIKASLRSQGSPLPERLPSRASVLRRMPARVAEPTETSSNRSARGANPSPNPGDWARASRLAQGLPPVVTDPLVLRNVRTIMKAGQADGLAPIVPLKSRRQRGVTDAKTQPHDELLRRDVAL